MSDIAELLETDEKLENSSTSSDESDEVLGDDETAEPSDEPADETAEPADEIVAGFLSLNEVKIFCRVIGNADDEILRALVLSAKSFFESYTQRQMSDFKCEIPDEIKQWARVKVASWYDMRVNIMSGTIISHTHNDFIDCVLDRWRKSPLRLLPDENQLLKAQVSAQNELIAQMAQQILTLKGAPTKPEITEPAEPETAEQAEQNLEFLAPQEQENEQTKESENEAI